MARGADEPSLPALPKVSPDRWRQEYTGCSTVLAITLTDLVLVHANGWADAAANGAFTQLHGALMLAVDGLAVLAMLMLAGVMCGGRDLVVRRTHETVTPLPPAVRELLIAGESLEGLANLVDGEDSYCVRCCVWRRPPPPPTPICCGGSGGGRSCRPLQPRNRAHHCRYCGECVLGFDHHCGFFGRCITGSLLYGGGNMRAFIGIISVGYAAAAVAGLSLALRLLFDAHGRFLPGWPQRAAAGLALLWCGLGAAAMLLQCLCRVGAWVWRGAAQHRVRWRGRGVWRGLHEHSTTRSEDEEPLNGGDEPRPGTPEGRPPAGRLVNVPSSYPTLSSYPSAGPTAC